ncbi:MAG: hypothetical protein RL033_4879 [Pseudomonadota bacterium]
MPSIHPVRALVALTVLFLSMLCACSGDDSSELDTTAPAVAVSATVGADAVLLSAEVSDNVAVTQVEFVVDGGATRATVGDSRGQRVFATSIPLERLSVGSHRLEARALDAAGNATEAEAVRFVIGANGPGSSEVSPIQITLSSSNDGGSVTFTVDIASEELISLTNFFLDGEFLGGRGDPQTHFTLTRSLAPGTHQFLVDVTDVRGNGAQEELIVEI